MGRPVSYTHLVDRDKEHIYALSFANDRAFSQIRLNRFGIERPDRIYMADSIPYQLSLRHILPNEKARQKHIKRVEKGLKDQYTPRMKKLAFAQGKLLIKLIDRQSNSTSYELVKAFMGPFKMCIRDRDTPIHWENLTVCGMKLT